MEEGGQLFATFSHGYPDGRGESVVCHIFTGVPWWRRRGQLFATSHAYSGIEGVSCLPHFQRDTLVGEGVSCLPHFLAVQQRYCVNTGKVNIAKGLM